MLVARNLRLAAIRYVQISHCTRSTGVKTLPILQAVSVTRFSRPLAANYSKEAKTADPASNLSETPSISNIPKKPSECFDKELSPLLETDKDTKTKAEECSTGSVADVGVKLPSKDQVESFLFKSLVYFWDFLYYTFCLSRKLIDTYVVKNATVQTNWRQLLKRMEEARKDINSK